MELHRRDPDRHVLVHFLKSATLYRRAVNARRPSSLLHRRIFQDRRAVLPVEKFTDKGPTDIVLINRPKRSGDETPQQSKELGGVRIPRDYPGPKNCQSFKSEPPYRIFLFAHDAGITNPALSATPGRRKKSESLDSPSQAAACKCAYQSNFQLLNVLFAPLPTPFTDANT